MEPIAVLVVDDSAVVRRIVTSVLSEDPGIRVVGGALRIPERRSAARNSTAAWTSSRSSSAPSSL